MSRRGGELKFGAPPSRRSPMQVLVVYAHPNPDSFTHAVLEQVTEEEYDRGWREAMDTVVCEWGLKMAGVERADRHYLYAVVAADDDQRRAHLDEAYRRGREF
jgi:putative NADPH-quinone reductase